MFCPTIIKQLVDLFLQSVGKKKLQLETNSSKKQLNP